MNKTDLVAAVAAKTELSKKDAEAAVSAVFELVFHRKSLPEYNMPLPGGLCYRISYMLFASSFSACSTTDSTR